MFTQKSCLLRGPVVVLMLLLVFGFSEQLSAQQQDPNKKKDLFEMSIEELMNVEVVSSARRAQPIARSTGAIYVITAEDIRMAGVTKLADLFRLVPGMQVNQILDFSSQVGIRGFAQRNAARIQILLDGVSMYDAYKGGCELEFYPIILDDIDRIEVIRGPAAVAWGVNAMNGVINIITKKAADTQGIRTYGGLASNHMYEGYIEIGGQTGNVAGRATVGSFYTHGLGSDQGDAGTDVGINDYSHNFTTTGRGEVRLKDGALLTVSGGQRQTTYGTAMVHPSLEYMTLVWDKKYSKESSLKLTWAENWFENMGNTSYDVRSRQDLLEIQNTLDWGTHKIVWGGDYTRDSFHTIIFYDPISNPKANKSIDDPNSFSNDQVSAFAEDEITLAKNFWFTIGGRLQHNELTGQDWAGNAVLTWEAVPNHFLRAGVSRAFARPVMQAYFYSLMPYNKTRITERAALDGLDNEHITAYQLGYRGQIMKNLDLDIEGFYHRNTDMIGSYEKGSPIVRYNGNIFDVTSYGIETSLDYKPFAWWLIRGTHSYEHQTEADRMNRLPPRLIVPSVPQHTATLTNRFYLDNSTTLNTQLFYTDTYHLENANAVDYDAAINKVDKRIRLDVHLARKIGKNAEIAIGVKNVNDPYHYEGNTTGKVEVDYNRIVKLYYLQFYYQF
jgi:iron complex outermembrane recepter protein